MARTRSRGLGRKSESAWAWSRMLAGGLGLMRRPKVSQNIENTSMLSAESPGTRGRFTGGGVGTVAKGVAPFLPLVRQRPIVKRRWSIETCFETLDVGVTVSFVCRRLC
jgi:hypothetical protein